MRKFKDYVRLIGFIKPHMALFVVVIICMFISTSLGNIATIGSIIPAVTVVLAGKKISLPKSSTIPVFLRAPATDFVNYINSLDRIQVLHLVVVVVLVLFLAKEIFRFLHEFLSRRLSLEIVKDVRNQIYNKLMSLSVSFFSKHRAGQLVSRITYDSDIVKNAIAEALRDMIHQSIQAFVLIVMLIAIIITWNIPWWFILVFGVVVPLTVYPITRMGKRVRSISTSAQEEMSDINSILYESFSGIHIIKAFDMSQYEKDKFKDKNQSFYRYLVKEAKRLAVVNPITEYISVCAALVVVYLSARMIIIKGFDPGVFTAFMIVLFQLVDPVKKLSKVHLINQQALAAATRLYKILDTETDIKENPEAKILTKFEKDIEFKKVSFKYDDKEVLKDINLRVSKGNRVAIVGRSGVGKTTLVNLIPRFYDPTKGKILIDGIDLKDVTLASLRKHMGIVTQDTILFNDTVKANIAYGDINASFERIKKAAKVANAHNFIKELPKGYDTTIGDRGFKLSGGEKQRIAIARAILKNPAILILDEATSQLDTESEQLVQEALDHLIKGRTTFVIAHRLSTAQGASFIVVLDKGKILELNTHKELMEKGGLYRKLYNLQFEDVG